MSDDKITVVNNENPTIDLEITTYTNSIDVDLNNSIDSALSVHNTDYTAHANIKNALESQISALNFLMNTKVNQEIGKSLTTNDLTAALKSNYDTAYTNTHTHSNKTLLDNLISSGAGTHYLSNDGTYKIADSNNIINSLGTISANFTLVNNQVTTGTISGNYTLTLPTMSSSTREAKCIFDFTTSNASYPSIVTAGITLKKKDGKALTYSTLFGVRNRLIFTTIDAGSTWEVELQQYGGVETTFVQSALTANGTLGGSAQAVSASSEYNSSYAAYMASDSNSSTFWMANVTTGYYIRYNPQAVKATSFDFVNQSGGGCAPNGGIIYASNDNSNYLALTSFANTVNTSLGTWSVAIPSANQAFYNYYKIYISGIISGSQIALTQITQNGTYIATS